MDTFHIVKNTQKKISRFGGVKKFFSSNFFRSSGLMKLVAFVIPTLGLITAVVLVQQNQNIINKAAGTHCSDDIDNDGDGKIDFDGYRERVCSGRRFDRSCSITTYPRDPDCSSPDDNSEAPGSSCDGISIVPDKDVYTSGEEVTITVNSSGPVSGIRVFWDQANRNIVREKTSYSNGHGGTLPVEIGSIDSFDSTLKSWTAKWNVPKDGEYIIYPRIYLADEIGQPSQLYCTGNPAFPCSGCEKGAIDNGDVNFNPTDSCQGCYKTIAVDSYYDYTQGPDLATYWNFQPGNSYFYQGVNINSSTTLWHALNTIEEKVNVCGLTLTPWRMTKDNDLAYNWPNTDKNRRIFMSAFEAGQPWSSNNLGKPVAHDYHRNPADGTNGLGTLGSEDPTPLLERSTSVNLINTQRIPIEHRYYSPHYFTKRFVPNGWNFDWMEHIQYPVSEVFTNCDWKYNATGHERYIKNAVYYVNQIPSGFGNLGSNLTNVKPPAYNGPGIVVKLLECGTENCDYGDWAVREDWYFAPNVGRVRLDQRVINDKTQLLPASKAELTNGSPMQDLVVNGVTYPLSLSMELVSYYTNNGKPLRVDFNSEIPTDEKLGITVTTSEGLPYTGWLESKTCVSNTSCTPGTSFKWGGWIQDGEGTMDYSATSPNFESGTHHSYFRPWVETAPAGTPGETRISTTNLAWSNEVIYTVGTTPTTCPPGYGDCDKDPSNSCETSLNTTSNCGSCGNACGRNERCRNGMCIYYDRFY